MEVFVWTDVGRSTFLGSDSYTLNTCKLLTPRKDKPSLLSTLFK